MGYVLRQSSEWARGDWDKLRVFVQTWSANTSWYCTILIHIASCRLLLFNVVARLCFSRIPFL